MKIWTRLPINAKAGNGGLYTKFTIHNSNYIDVGTKSLKTDQYEKDFIYCQHSIISGYKHLFQQLCQPKEISIFPGS